MPTATLNFDPEENDSSLERMNQCSIALSTLSSRIADLHHDARFPQYSEQVESKLAHLHRIAQQLDEDVNLYPTIVFHPGRLCDSLDALIAKKEAALAACKARLQTQSNISLCNDFLHGMCSRGVTCSENHSLANLDAHIRSWIESVCAACGGDSRATVLTVQQRYGAEAWSCLIRILSTKSFESIVVRHCDKTALVSLARAVKRNEIRSLKAIDLGHNRLGSVFPRGMLKFAQALRSNESVHALSLGYNYLGASGSLAVVSSAAASASGSTITSLNLSGNGIVSHDAAFSLLCEGLARCTALKKLGLAHNFLGADGVKKLLHALTGIHGGPSPGSGDSGGSGDAGSHGTCSPSPAAPAAADAVEVASVQRLECLDLFAVQCGDTGGNAIRQYVASAAGSYLRLLNVGWNRLTFESVVGLCLALETHTRLEVLSMPYNLGIGRKGSIAVAEYIKKNSTITSLDLRWTSMGDDGAATIADAVATNKQSIRSIRTAGNDLDSRTEQVLLDRIKKALGTPVLERGLKPLCSSDEVW